MGGAEVASTMGVGDLSSSPGRRVLVVDDEVLVAMLITDMLEDLGHQVIGPAHDLDDGLALAKAGGFDCAILDISLNGKSSMPIADTLRQRGLPFMFASGYPPNPDETGFEGVPLLQKPFDMRQVEEALEHETFRAG
jgi:CheY-like chemotaxis protein